MKIKTVEDAAMTKKYDRFLPSEKSFDVNNFPYYWISQVHAQYVINIDNVLKNTVSIIHDAASYWHFIQDLMPVFHNCLKW